MIIRIAFLFLLIPTICAAQNTVTSGNWSDPTVWSGGAIPIPSGTVNVNHPLTIDANLSPTGPRTFASNATDQPGGTVYFFNPNAGTNTVTINAGITVTFEGGGADETSNGPNCNGCNQFDGGSINIFGTLILASTRLNNNLDLNITIQPGGTLIINGDLIGKNNSGTLIVNGALIVNGKFDLATGSVTVGGSGTINTTGPLTSNGASTIFGTTNDCTTGPCSGETLTCTFTNTVAPTSKAICSGSTAGTLTSTTNATSPTYQWKSSTDNITYGNATGTSTNSTYATPALTQTTWFKVAVTSSTPCTSNSAPVKVTVLPTAGGWIGSTSTAWSTTGNWCSNSIPINTTDVVISNASGIANMPTVSAGIAAVCRNLTISNTFPISTLALAVSATTSLSIFGNLTNNGTFTDNTTAAAAGVKFTGSTLQTIAGATANVFNNLTIANTLGGTPDINITTNNVTVKNNLTMTSGVVNLNGYTLTLGTGAAAANNGVLVYTTGSRFYGGNIERWFPNTAVTVGAAASQFSIGSDTDYRPMFFGSSGLTTGGTIKVSHTGTNGSTLVSFLDGVSTVQVRSNSFWKVTTGNGISSGGTPIVLRTEGTGFGTVGAVADLRTTLINSAAPGTAGTNAGTLTNPQVNRTGFSVANISNSFYWGSINSSQTPLPITLISFSGNFVTEGVELSWSTASQENFDYFQVGRSVNGVDFIPIQTLNGEAFSTSVINYHLLDREVKAGKYYYRLKNVDRDGTYDYSKIIVLEKHQLGSISLYPNPVSANQMLTINVDSQLPQKVSAIIYDPAGRILKNKLLVEGENQVEMSGMASGIYFVMVRMGSEQFASKFVVK